jgi:hypothetical protein
MHDLFSIFCLPLALTAGFRHAAVDLLRAGTNCATSSGATRLALLRVLTYMHDLFSILCLPLARAAGFRHAAVDLLGAGTAGIPHASRRAS